MDEIELSSSQRVLVAVMNAPRDLEIARHEGWYRIPLKRAPRRVGADYLAFYQTKAFGDERWAVNYYAPTRRYRLFTRAELLPEETDHARATEQYYKVEIGPLQRLPRPIPSRRLRRITFISTTLERLLKAEEINDLWDRGSREDRLWEAFKREGIEAERQYEVEEGMVRHRNSEQWNSEQFVVDFAIFCQEGQVAVICEGESAGEGPKVIRERQVSDYDLTAVGWIVLRFDRQQLSQDVPGCLAAVREAVSRCGGVTVQPIVL
jgi:very-short-patch-repair endonuclease